MQSAENFMSHSPNSNDLAFNNRNHTRVSLLPKNSLRRSIQFGRTRLGKRPRTSDRFSKHYPIIVHSHLCWDWVWQRPQQFISRLSQRHKILFVETIGPDAQLLTPFARFRTDEQ